MKNTFRSWNDALRFSRDPNVKNGIVFYSEGQAYQPFLSPLINALVEYHDYPIFYLTSDVNDVFIHTPPANVRSYYLGDKGARTFALNLMKARLLVMTMPDLNSFHIKRSPNTSHYTYVHHSMVSTHMVYRAGAFDHFDSILCVGPYQIDEIREWEKINKLAPKILFQHGYGPLDYLIQERQSKPEPSFSKTHRLNILVAPSWGPNGLMENYSFEVIEGLLSANHKVYFRPHPRTRQISGRLLDQVKKNYISHPDFYFSEDTSNFDDFFSCHLMISDWSGVAMEFSFGLERPVLFIDTPPKINNSDYIKLNLTPFEMAYRDEVGITLTPEQIEEIPRKIYQLYENYSSYQSKIQKLRDDHIFNVGSSATNGAKKLVEALELAG